jgi:hypothetical protein
MDLPRQVQWGDVLKNKKITPIYVWGVAICGAEPFPHRAKYLVPMNGDFYAPKDGKRTGAVNCWMES